MQDSFLSLYTLGDLKLLCWRWRRLMVITFAAVFIPAAAVTL